MPPKGATPAPPKTPAAGAAAAKAEDKAAPPPEDAASAPPPEDESVVKRGTFSFADGATYTGEFRVLGGGKQPVRHGHGVLQTGPERYDGHWENDQMHGRGAYHFATGAVYEGEFQGNVFHGRGRYQWPDGAVYDGEWRGGRMHGDGASYVDRAGVAWNGRFVNGKFDNGRIFHTLR